MNYIKIKQFDVANSPGIGSTLFVSGCKFHCPNCFNKEAWDFNYGQKFTKDTEDLFISYLQHPQVKNANLLGGEVTQQDSNIILNLVKRIKSETNCNIWMWTGDLFENLIKRQDQLEILKYVNVLVDGRFVEELKDLKIKYRGSSNQRVLNVPESIKQNKIILYME